MANSPRDVSRSQMGRGRCMAQRGSDGFLQSIGSGVRRLSKREHERDRESAVGLLHHEAKLGNDSCMAERPQMTCMVAAASAPNSVRSQAWLRAGLGQGRCVEGKRRQQGPRAL
jgi:hypothetical protein